MEINMKNLVVPAILIFAASLTIGLTYFAWNYLFPEQVAEIALVDTANSCNVKIILPRPTPSISSTSTGEASPKCRVSFTQSDTTVCDKNKKDITVSYTVHSLPPGGPYYMQTDWYSAAPLPQGPHHYDESQMIEAGKTYSFKIEWPGRPENSKETFSTHAGLNVVDQNHQIISPNCSGGLAHFWTPYVSCP